ncbi:MAG: hypothetical protein K8I29_11025, partial [Alphaproteobacteria bacterium]|nr:hypothetical protein [Candidatus Nitrobium versatile]
MERKKLEEEIRAMQSKEKELLERKNRELAEAYRDLKSAQSQILQQEKMASIGQLAAGVAHEINNPMGFIMSNLGSLQKYMERLAEFMKVQQGTLEALAADRGTGGEGAAASSGAAGGGAGAFLDRLQETRRSLKIDYILEDTGNLIRESLEGAERVKSIVRDLKSFSRADETEYKTADINAGIESTVNIVWNELKYKAVLKKEYGEIPLVRCNIGQLNQVFMNILVNAAHAIEKQG